ncbi:hypothetical protein E1A91_D11G389300v1 [Gossypium mustelinum]|uniref:Uncharacterized protein n=1 Tax=Gossypium mustelinum TaxID=34275 RepID=A0A5D2T0Y1_GOSMU|nr:hypothetical protein E1A91_D11G389300v1 [Gossypium mustelinum]
MNPLAMVSLMYCLSVNVTGFVHVGFQTYTLAYHLVTKKHVISPWIRQVISHFSPILSRFSPLAFLFFWRHVLSGIQVNS